MSETFLRVDLRDGAQGQAHDFRKVALQPGLPLLDPSNTNYRTLRKWFGVYVAQPKFASDRPDSIGFCVCDQQDRQIVDARCEPLTENDLKGRSDIIRQFEELKSKLQTIQPDNPKETTLLNAIRGHFSTLTANPGNLGFSFFKYKNGSRWQLVWLWGFERRDSKPAVAAVCKRPGCRHLIARRIGETSSCPVCQGPPTPFPKASGSSRSRFPLAVLLLLALLGGALFAFRSFFAGPKGPEVPVETAVTDKVQATYAVKTVPELEQPWRIPLGGRLKYRIVQIHDGKEEDVTDRVDVMTEDPQTARIDRDYNLLRTRNVGETGISFHLEGKEIKKIPLTVLEPTMPETLRLDPAKLTIGVGTNRQLILLGKYADGRIIDLTDAALWKPNESPAVSNVLGLLEGLEEGKADIATSYTVGKETSEATCRVDVVPENYTAIEIRGVPNRLYEGFGSVVEVTTKNEKGEERILTRSSRLRFHVEPPEAAFLENGNLLSALIAGQAKLRALYDTVSAEVLEASVDFEVVRDETASHFLVQPEELKLVVGETVLLDILPRGPDAVNVACKDDNSVIEFDNEQIIGRKPGKTILVVSQNNVQKEIPVEVVAADWQKIFFEPDRISVAVDDTAPLRMVGLDALGRRHDIAWGDGEWEPPSNFVRIDAPTGNVIGLKPTDKEPIHFQLRFGGKTAVAHVTVLPAPMRLSMAPMGSVDLPVDQQIRFAVRANYGNGDMEIALDRVQWSVSPETLPEGVVWDASQGILKAEKSGLGPIEISATYLGETAKSCLVKTCDSSPVEIEVTADKPSLRVGEQGNILITPKDATSPCIPIPEKYSFTTAESNILHVDPKTGEFRGSSPGKGTIAVSHPAVKGENSAPITVEESNKPRLVLRPDNITLNVGETAVVSLVKIDGDREQKIPFVQTGEPLLTAANSAAIRIRLPDRIVGVRSAPPFKIFAKYQGEKAMATVEVKAKRSSGPKPAKPSGFGASDPKSDASDSKPGKPGGSGASDSKPDASGSKPGKPGGSGVSDPKSPPKPYAPAPSEDADKDPGKESTLTVEAGDQPFYRISLDRSANRFDNGQFQVHVKVEAKTKNKELEYRIVPLEDNATEEDDGEQSWVPLETDEDGRQQVRLTSPKLRGDDVDERHHLTIEVRDKKTDQRQKHPFDFQIKEKTGEIEQ